MITEYNKEYTDSGFWNKLVSFSGRAGRRVIELALTLYNCLKDEDTPAWAKAVIYGALGYFITPVDAVPDLLPLVGFSDDIAAMIAAISIIAGNIKESHKVDAQEKVRVWLG
ncbi:MAG: DUF1232 domain-containing protein [Chlorobi bacterium]|nr:DUF1232 domain-containing protein [Chlorobiota bacterium]